MENNNDNSMRGALWERISQSGSKYYNGSITIDGKEYWLTMFHSDKKGNTKAPDFKLKAEPKEKPVAKEKEEFGQLTEDDYAEFGKQHEEEIDDNFLPF